jgi:hypothetical protein
MYVMMLFRWEKVVCARRVSIILQRLFLRRCSANPREKPNIIWQPGHSTSSGVSMAEGSVTGEVTWGNVVCKGERQVGSNMEERGHQNTVETVVRQGNTSADGED